MLQYLRDSLANIAKGAFVAVPAAIAFQDLVGTVVPVTGRSMQPTLNPNAQGEDAVQDYVWEGRWMVPEGIERGDIVAYRSPFGPEVRVVKRLVALDGDWVRPSLHRPAPLQMVPKGHCWVEGDNPRSSDDSRTYGPIPIALIEGRVTHVIWPPERMGALPRSELP